MRKIKIEYNWVIFVFEQFECYKSYETFKKRSENLNVQKIENISDFYMMFSYENNYPIVYID